MAQDTRHQEAGVDSLLDGRYRLRREIARGGHGAVFEGEHQVTRGRVAIKTLSRSSLALPAAHARLLREARVLGALRHPNLIAVYDAGTCATYGPYLVLEMIEGRPLDGILVTRQTLPVDQTLAVALQLCDALSEVHRHGIVHRDVKPSNLLIAKAPGSDRVELIDFGIAKIGNEEDAATSKLTKAGELLGTVEYMAPEQIMGHAPVDARTDVYAVGVVLYECLTGEVPRGGAPTAVIANMLAGTRTAEISARRTDVPSALEAAVRKAIEIDPGKRFSSVAELASACLHAFERPIPALDLLGAEPTPQAVAKLSLSLPLQEAAAHRRQYARAPYITPVRVLIGQNATDGRTEDLSEGGVLMVTETGVPDGQQVKLRLPLPVSGRVVELDAITKWIKAGRNRRATGAEFINAPEDVRAEIRAYVALMTGGVTPAPSPNA